MRTVDVSVTPRIHTSNIVAVVLLQLIDSLTRNQVSSETWFFFSQVMECQIDERLGFDGVLMNESINCETEIYSTQWLH